MEDFLYFDLCVPPLHLIMLCRMTEQMLKGKRPLPKERQEQEVSFPVFICPQEDESTDGEVVKERPAVESSWQRPKLS